MVVAMAEREAAVVDGVAATSPRTASHSNDVRGLVEEHGPAVYSMCARILRDRVLAEDILQQVFLEAHRDLERFQGQSSIRTWLIGIAMHRCQDAIKARRRREQRFQADERAIDDAVDLTADPRAPLEKERVNKALGECLDELSIESRAAVLMRFHVGMSYEDMAGSVGDKPDTLRARVVRALPLVRRCLERKGWTG
jgi:RNA polymerase sigma-70 factor (ECF subfamily)